MANESTINEKLAYLEATKQSIRAAITAKGQEIDDTTTFRQYAVKISDITTGPDTMDANATADDIALGKIAYVKGEKLVGTLIPTEDLSAELTAQNAKIELLETALENKTEGGGKVKLYSTYEELLRSLPQSGQLAVVYDDNTGVFTGFYKYNGTTWIQISPSTAGNN